MAREEVMDTKPRTAAGPLWEALCQLLDEMLPFLDSSPYRDREQRLTERMRWFGRAEALAIEAEAAAPAEGLDVEVLGPFVHREFCRGMQHEYGYGDKRAMESIAAEYARLATSEEREAFARSGNARSGLPTDADLERYRAAPAEGLRTTELPALVSAAYESWQENRPTQTLAAAFRYQMEQRGYALVDRADAARAALEEKP